MLVAVVEQKEQHACQLALCMPPHSGMARVELPFAVLLATNQKSYGYEED
jgi:hypothetical protein